MNYMNYLYIGLLVGFFFVFYYYINHYLSEKEEKLYDLKNENIYNVKYNDKYNKYNDIYKNVNFGPINSLFPFQREKKRVIIVSLTTSPRRIKLMQKTIESILNQTTPPDLIRINIPKIFKRTGEIYEIPDYLLNHPKIQIVQHEKDYGPIMKILHTIIDYKDHPNVNIIYTDDDVLMLPRTIETFLEFSDTDNVLCFSGIEFNGLKKWERNKLPSFVNVPEGYMGVFINNNVLNKMKYSIMDYYNLISTDEYCFTSDDLMLGNFFAMNEILVYRIHDEKVNFDLWWSSGCELSYGKDGDGISSLESDQHFTRYNKAYDFLKINKMNYILKN